MEVGNVFTRLGFREDPTEANRYERRVQKLRGESKHDIKTDAKLDVDQRGFDQYGRNVRNVDRHHDGLVRSSAKVRTGFGTVWGAGGAAFAAAGGAYGLAKGVQAVVGAYSESQKVGAQTTSVLRSTGHAAGVSADHVGKLAGAISKKSGQDDEAIQSGENLLLTFTNIRNETGKGNDIFDQTTNIMADMSQALGQDTKSSAIQLGKALNDPIKGVTALQRVGVSFTKSQKDQIAHLENTGHHLDAQKIILKELQKEFGGSAKAYGQTLPGAMDKAKVAMGNVAETIGGKLAPWLTKGANFLADLLNGGGKAPAVFGKIRGAVSSVGDVFGRVFKFVGSVISSSRSQINSIAGSISARFKMIVGAIGSIFNAAKKTFSGGSGIGNDIRSIVRFVLTLVAAFEKVANAVLRRMLPGIVTAFRGVFQVIRGAVRIISGILTLNFGKVWDGVKDIFSGALKVIGGLLRAATAPFREIAARIGRGIGAAFTAAWNGIKSIFRGAVRAVVSIVRGIVDNASAAARAVGRAISRAFSSAWSAIKGVFRAGLNGAVSIVRGFVDNLRAAATAVGKAIINGLHFLISDLPGKLRDALVAGVSKVRDWIANFGHAAADVGKNVVKGLINGLGQLGGALVNAAKSLGSKIINAVKDFLGISSPSKAFMEIGGHIVSGLIHGMNFDRVKDFIGHNLGGMAKLAAKLVKNGAVEIATLPIKGVLALGSLLTRGGGVWNDRVKHALSEKAMDAYKHGDLSAAQIRTAQQAGLLPHKLPKKKAAGGRVGPTAGGARLFIAGEGNADEWVISQEGDRKQNIGWAVEALRALTGRAPDLHRRGKGKRKKAPHYASANSVAGGAPGRADDSITNIERDLSRLDRLYGQLERGQNVTQEEFVTENADGTASLNRGAIDHRVGEIDDLIAFKRDRIKRKIEDYQRALAAAIGVYKDAIKRLVRALKRAKGRRGSGNAVAGYRTKIDDYNARIAELGDAGRDLDLDLGDINLDIDELQGERASVLGTAAPASTAATGDGSSGGSSGDGSGAIDPGTGGASPTDIAAAAMAEISSYRSAQQELFAGFGGNFARSGTDPFSGFGAEAGLRFFGATGVTRGLFGAAGAGGAGVTVNIEQNFGATPPAPHLWTDETVNRISGALG